MNTNSESKKPWLIISRKLPTTLAGVLLLAVTSFQTYAAPGDVDLSFDPGSGVNGEVNAIAMQNDGRILIGGTFTTVHGAMRNGIARLNDDGSTDQTFLAVVTNAGLLETRVRAIAVQSDSKIIIGGIFTSVNGITRTNLVRLNVDGSIDTTFLSGLDGPDRGVETIAVQSDGKVLIAGGFSSVNGEVRDGFARLNADGSLDVSFLVTLQRDVYPGSVSGIVLQADARIVIRGAFDSVNGEARNNIARLNADGSLDTSFLPIVDNTEANVFFDAVAPQSDGKMLIAGNFTAVNGVAQTNVARLNSDGSLDSSFLYCTLQEVFGGISSFVVQSDGKILVGGGGVNGFGDNIARLNSDGTLDSSFRSAPNFGVDRIALQSDGKILIVGNFTSINGVGRRCLARINTDGSLDDSFVNGPSGPAGEVRAIALQNDGKILVGGGFIYVNGAEHSGLARLNADGSLDDSFSNTLFEHAPDQWNPFVFSLAVQADGRIVVGGQFTSVNGVAQTNIARINADGSLDTSFRSDAVLPNGNGNSSVECVALQTDGKILISGEFNTVDGVEQNNFARLNADGSLDSSFNASLGPNGGGGGPIAIQGNGKILIAGNFSSVNGEERHNIARLNADGSLDTSFLNGLDGVNNWVLAIALQPDGKILIGSQFSLVNGIARTNLARLNTDGSLDNFFLGGLDSADNGVRCLALQSDGKILIGGWFSSVNGVARNRIARLNPDGSLDTTFLNGLAGPDGDISSLALQPDGKIVIGGVFTAVNQIPRSHVARLMGEYAPLAIKRSPQSQTAESGSTVDFGVRVTGFPPPILQWFCNGNAIVGCTNSVLCLSGVQATNVGAYSVIVSNIFGAVTSAPVMLNVIPMVERRPVPAVNLAGQAGSLMGLDYRDTLDAAANWETMATMTLSNVSQLYFDVSVPLPPARFYRVWQTGTPAMPPSLNLPFLVPAITLTGNIGDSLRLDYINQFGPTNAWVTLDMVTLTNTSQLYFDVTAPGQPRRLYRILPNP